MGSSSLRKVELISKLDFKLSLEERRGGAYGFTTVNFLCVVR